MSLKDQLKKDAEDIGVGYSASYLKFENGEYEIRILTQPIALGTHFFGKGGGAATCYGEKDGCPFHQASANSDLRIKYNSYVLDRKDNRIKMADLPVSVVRSLADLEESKHYSFTEYPVPYDLMIKVDKKEKSPKDIYKTTPVPLRVDLTGIEQDQLRQKLQEMPVDKFVLEKKQKQVNEHLQDGTYQAEQERRKVLVANGETAETKAIRTVNDVEHAEPKEGEIPF